MCVLEGLYGGVLFVSFFFKMEIVGYTSLLAIILPGSHIIGLSLLAFAFLQSLA